MNSYFKWDSFALFLQNLEVAINERGTFLSASIPENKSKNRFAILPCKYYII